MWRLYYDDNPDWENLGSGRARHREREHNHRWVQGAGGPRQAQPGDRGRRGALIGVHTNRDLPLPGDWFCIRCGNHNHARHQVCHRWRCGQRRGHDTAEVPLPANARRCGVCGFIVYGTWRACPRCEAPANPGDFAGGAAGMPAHEVGLPTRDNRPQGFAGTARGDPDLVHFLVRLITGEPTEQEQRDNVEDLLHEGEGVTWILVQDLANYWMPRSRQREGLPTLELMYNHVQDVVAAATDAGGNRLFHVDFRNLHESARRFRLADVPGQARAHRWPVAGDMQARREETPNFFAPAGGLLARGRNDPLPEPEAIDAAQDAYMRDLQQRIEEEMRHEMLLRQGQRGEEDPQGLPLQQFEVRHGGQEDGELPEEPGDALGSADWEREWHEQRGLAPPQLRQQEEEEQRRGDRTRHGQENGGAEAEDQEQVQPCAYRDVRLSWADNQEDREEQSASASEGEGLSP